MSALAHGSEPLVFNGKWAVKGTIGKGAFSEIYAALDETNPTEGLVAIKLQNADFDSSVMKWESMVMTDLSSISTIPKFKYYGHEHGRDYMVMELLTGEDMSSLRDRSRLSIPSRLLPMEVASLLTRQMLNCLQAMHEKGYVHRDVKPSNFVRRSKNTTEFCVIDFGLAKLHRDANGKVRTERENVDFRGTTIYASPYVHSGHDQCPRDDVYCTLHVFLDLVLGDLPWRTHARNRDKAAVAAVKASLMNNPAVFLQDYLKLQESSGNLDEASMNELRAVMSSIEGLVCDFVAHMKSLSYCDNPDYAYIQELFRRPVDPALLDAQVGDIAYTANGFSWNDGHSLEDAMARYNASAVQSSHNNRSRRSTDRLSLGDAAAMDGATAGPGVEPGGVEASSSGGQAAFSNKPFVLGVRTQGSSGEYKLQNLHDKLRALMKETEAFKAAQAAAQAQAEITRANSSCAADGNYWPTTTSAPAAPSSSSQQASSTEKLLLGLEMAVRWRNLTRELMKLSDVLVASHPALELCLQVLVSNDHFYACNLGELDRNWAEFADVQSIVGAFYEYYATARRNRAKSLESLLAEVGGGTSSTMHTGAANTTAPIASTGLDFPEDASVGQVVKHRGRRIQDSDELGSEASLPAVASAENTIAAQSAMEERETPLENESASTSEDAAVAKLTHSTHYRVVEAVHSRDNGSNDIDDQGAPASKRLRTE